MPKTVKLLRLLSPILCLFPLWVRGDKTDVASPSPNPNAVVTELMSLKEVYLQRLRAPGANISRRDISRHSTSNVSFSILLSQPLSDRWAGDPKIFNVFIQDLLISSRFIVVKWGMTHLQNQSTAISTSFSRVLNPWVEIDIEDQDLSSQKSPVTRRTIDEAYKWNWNLETAVALYILYHKVQLEVLLLDAENSLSSEKYYYDRSRGTFPTQIVLDLLSFVLADLIKSQNLGNNNVLAMMNFMDSFSLQKRVGDSLVRTPKGLPAYLYHKIIANLEEPSTRWSRKPAKTDTIELLKAFFLKEPSALKSPYCSRI